MALLTIWDLHRGGAGKLGLIHLPESEEMVPGLDLRRVSKGLTEFIKRKMYFF